MKVQLGSFFIQNQLVKTITIENCRKTEDDMDTILRFFYEESFKVLTRVVFKESIIEKIPFSLHIFFPSLKILDLTSCGLEVISKFDLRGLTHLVALMVDGNKLTTLPPGLFMHTPNLRSISFSNNQLKVIDENILEPLKKLKFANFSSNKTIDVIYSKSEDTSQVLSNTVSLEKLNQIIAKYCQLTKEFTISVEGHAFKVDRSAISSQSSAIAKIFENNRETEIVELTDVTVNAFRAINEYITEGDITWSIADPREVLTAAKKLQIKALMSIALQKILKSLDESNAIEILIFSNTQDIQALKKPAFDIIRKKFEANSIPDRLMNDPKKLHELVMAKDALDSALAKAHENFNNVYNSIIEW